MPLNYCKWDAIDDEDDESWMHRGIRQDHDGESPARTHHSQGLPSVSIEDKHLKHDSFINVAVSSLCGIPTEET